ncbi:endonuclease [Gilvibacter sp. SZ-19]|jgi:putative endonuclease|uniref:GIY-YIG nuclease family protein n=1 Tax=Gilvibacter TaxID=379070 RepID=UPI000B3C6DE4|nr:MULTISPECIES: GIY-YIG nuclease family protein [Gilvibacter]ARV12516.1 endonuclease [Gilvibacter sp. SZ-19]MDC7997508.1 GIY-YIG nuclease family protein [Gilvibacter sediminis]
MKHCVYMISNKKDGVLYVGKTKRLKQRIYQHKSKAHPNTFSARYNLDKLMYFEEFQSHEDALLRERRIKKWKRAWKIELIEKSNPNWRDLYEEI